MSKKLPIDISSLTKDKLREWISSFDIVLSDCDGVLWLYNSIIEGSDTAINRLIDLGKKIYFITNNSTKTRDEFVEKAIKMNFKVGQENIISTAYLAAQYLKQRNFDKKVYIVGSSGISQELDLVGIKHIGVGPDPMVGIVADVKDNFVPEKNIGAVVCGFDEHISFPKMLKAASYLSNPDTLFVGTNSDERFPMPNFIVPGTGSILRAIETCSERKATIMGKPNRMCVDIFFKDEPIKDPKRYLMIGDRLNTDILFGTNNNYQTLLVETGVHNLERVKEIIAEVDAGNNDPDLVGQIPDYWISSLGDLFNKYD